MSKVISVNAGSSSLKFQLFNMPSEEVICSGVFERIGLEEGIFTIKSMVKSMCTISRCQIMTLQSICF